MQTTITNHTSTLSEHFILRPEPSIGTLSGRKIGIDLENSPHVPFFRPITVPSLNWVMVPDVLPEEAVHFRRDRILKYPGIKEDVYVPFFRPDPSAMGQLGINGKDIMVTVRPPATNAHYHNPESERLLDAAIEFIGRNPAVKIILLPRYPEQARALRKTWSALFASGRMLIPEHVVDGLNLIWYSDFVISGGGTINL